MTVFGTANLVISVDVDSEDETMGLLEANYKFVNVVGYELVAIDCKGDRHKVTVHDCNKIELVGIV